MEIAVKNYVHQTAATMSVTYRREIVSDVSQDGGAQHVTQVGLKLQFTIMYH